MATTQIVQNWKDEWFEIEDAIYLNTAAHAAMPRVTVRAVQASIEALKAPHQTDDSAFFEVPKRIRTSLATMLGAKPQEIALTTGASTGVAAVTHLLKWNSGDEVISGIDEFPLQYATWKPMEEREGVHFRLVKPRDRFLTADDFIAALTPSTRLVSVSHVRFDDGSLLDAAQLARACHAQGTLLLLDVSQSCGAVPINVNELGADFLVCAGYKWLLSPYGTGFFWIKSQHLSNAHRGPFYWTAQPIEDDFFALNFVDPQPSHSARRWDSAEMASYFNINLTAMDASIDLVLRIGPELVLRHNAKLIDRLFERLPERFPAASPLDSIQRGPFGCFAAQTHEETAALYKKLIDEKVFVALRQGKIRVSPYLFNSEEDIDHVLQIIGV